MSNEATEPSESNEPSEANEANLELSILLQADKVEHVEPADLASIRSADVFNVVWQLLMRNPQLPDELRDLLRRGKILVDLPADAIIEDGALYQEYIVAALSYPQFAFQLSQMGYYLATVVAFNNNNDLEEFKESLEKLHTSLLALRDSPVETTASEEN